MDNNYLSFIANICSILGFLISLIAMTLVIRINNKIKSNNVIVKRTEIGGDFTGRDKNSK
jgi:hypothetical protein